MIIIDIFVAGCFFLFYGPYTDFKNMIISTAMVTKTHQYIAYTFYSEEEVSKVVALNSYIVPSEEINLDDIIIDTSDKKVYKDEYDKAILVRDEGNEDYKLINIKISKYDAYLVAIYDPSKVTAITSKTFNTGNGQESVLKMCKRYNGLVCINGGGFVDHGMGSDIPIGYIIKDGEVIWSDSEKRGNIIGITYENKLSLINATGEEAVASGIRDGLEFGPFLIVNGKHAARTPAGGAVLYRDRQAEVCPSPRPAADGGAALNPLRQKQNAGQPAGCPAFYFSALLIIVVQEHGLDDHHLVVFLLLHLNVGIELFQVLLDNGQGLLGALSAALPEDADHPVQHDGVGIAGRDGEVPGQDGFHAGNGSVPGGGDGLLVVLRRGDDLGAGEQEGGGETQQCEVQAGGVAVDELIDTVDAADNAANDDGQGHPAVGGTGAVRAALALGGNGKGCGLLRVACQEGLGTLQLLPGLLGLGGQLLEKFRLHGRLLFLQALLRLQAVGGQVRADLGDMGQQKVHILFVFEVALLHRAVVQLHHQIGNGAEDALSGKTALAHGDPLENTLHGFQRRIVDPVEEEAVQVNGLIAHAAGAEALAEFFVNGKRRLIQGRAAQLFRSKNHGIPHFEENGARLP